MSTHYAVLGLPENASPAAIRRAYRQLVLLTHPDRTPDPAQHRRYLAINEAYETLSNPARRTAYDAALVRQRQPVSQAPRPAQTRAQPASRRPWPPTIVFEASKRRIRVVHHFDYRPYGERARRWCQLLLLLPALLLLDYVAPKRTATAAFDTAAVWRNAADQATYSIRTTRGDFSTPDEAALNATAFRVRVSWLFRFVAEARLPNGRELPLENENTVLFSISGLLAVVAGAAQVPRLAAEMRVHLAIIASIAALIVLLMALAN